MAVVNSTSSFRLSARVDINVLWIENFENAKKNKGFDAISVRIFPPGHAPLTALVYSSGAVVMVGGTSEQQLEAAKDTICRMTRLEADDILRIHNLVASLTIERNLDLPQLFSMLDADERFTHVSYEPELFPAVTATQANTCRKACIFVSGKINLTGCKSHHELAVFENLIKSII